MIIFDYFGIYLANLITSISFDNFRIIKNEFNIFMNEQIKRVDDKVVDKFCWVLNRKQ